MIHPSYSELMKVVNSEVEPGDEPVINSRYSIVMATAKRARQLVSGQEPLVPSREGGKFRKPLSIAVDELNQGKIKIMGEEEQAEMLQAQQQTQQETIEQQSAEGEESA